LNTNYIQTNDLIHYWPFGNSLIDVIGGLNLYGGINNGLSFDKQSKPLSAISLMSGYYQAPASTYFYGGEFSIMAWVRLNSPNSHTRLVDFGNGSPGDNILCAISYLNSQKPFFNVYTSSPNSYSYTVSSVALNVGNWDHLACILKGTTGYIYINGVQTASDSFIMPLGVTRNLNYIGHSNWANELNADASIDELKIFKRGLSQQELINEMNNNMFL
jgi:hypothetical protein